MNAVDKLMGDRPSLSYEDIAELRKMVQDAHADLARVQQEQRWAEQTAKVLGEANVMFETMDGLRAFEKTPAVINFNTGSFLRFFERQERKDPEDEQPISEAADFSRCEDRRTRLYKFLGMRGTAARVFAHYKEVPVK